MRPPAVRSLIRALVLRPGEPASACAWINPQTPPVLYVVERPDCFASLPADCRTRQTLRPECWSVAPPVEPPPADVALEVLDCDPTGWRIRTVTGEDRVALGGTVEVGGVRVRLPASCSGECPAAEVLRGIRELLDGGVSRRWDCELCGPPPDPPCHPSCLVGPGRRDRLASFSWDAWITLFGMVTEAQEGGDPARKEEDTGPPHWPEEAGGQGEEG
jgi:hypothetical protein